MTKSKEYKCFGGFPIEGNSFIRTHELFDIDMKVVEEKIKAFGQSISIELTRKKEHNTWSVTFQREFMEIPDLKLYKNIILKHKQDGVSRMTIVVKPEDFIVRKARPQDVKNVWGISIRITSNVFMTIGHFNTREQMEACLKICKEGGKQTIKIGNWYNAWATEVLDFPMEYFFLDKIPVVKWNGIIPEESYDIDMATDVVYYNTAIYQ